MKKINIIVLLITVFSCWGCDDMLDFVPKTTLSADYAWNNAADFEKGANHFYEWLPRIMDWGSTGAGAVRGIGARDLLADLVLSNTNNVISNSQYTVPESDAYYNAYYERMRKINYFLEKAAGYSNQEEISRYVAEAHFFRAYYSYLFFADFGPGIIVKKVVDTSSQELTSPRNTREEFVDFMLEDLETAIEVLPYQSELSSDENGRITKSAAHGIMARVCLFEGTWQKYHYNNTERAVELLDKAFEGAEAIMGRTEFELFYNAQMGAESYRWMFLLEGAIQSNPYNIHKEANKEYIFRHRFDENIRVINQNVGHSYIGAGIQGTRKMIEMHLTVNGEEGGYDYVTSFESFMDGKDPRLSMNFRPVLDFVHRVSRGRVDWTGGEEDNKNLLPILFDGYGFQNWKYVSERYIARDGQDWGGDVPLIRLAEIYLIYAEAKCELQELGRGSLEQTDLDKSINKIRARVGMPALTKTNVPAGSTLKEEIRRERAIEMWLEGLRFDDVRRWKTAEIEMSQAKEGVPFFKGSYYTQDHSVTYPSGRQTARYTAPGITELEGRLSADGYYIQEAAAQRYFDPAKNYLMPIPRDQLILNSNMEQNGSW